MKMCSHFFACRLISMCFGRGCTVQFPGAPRQRSEAAREALKARALDAAEDITTTCTTPRHRRGYSNFDVARMARVLMGNH